MTAPGAPSRVLRVGSRASNLARVQTRRVGAALARLARTRLPREIVIETRGDLDTSTPLPTLGGRGIFTEALEGELLADRIDFAVHSLKDVPVDPTPGLVLAAIGFREDARDVLVSRGRHTLGSLARGACVGTCSIRRSAQLLLRRPDLEIAPLRGNVTTRVAKIASGEYDAIILAAAGLVRLGLASAATEILPFDVMLPAPGQGALAVQCRADDSLARALLAALDDPVVRATTDAERAFLEGLGGGCLAPIAAHAVIVDGVLELDGLVAAVDGSAVIRVRRTGSHWSGRDIGLGLAAEAIERGALDLLV